MRTSPHKDAATILLPSAEHATVPHALLGAVVAAQAWANAGQETVRRLQKATAQRNPDRGREMCPLSEPAETFSERTMVIFMVCNYSVVLR